MVLTFAETIKRMDMTNDGQFFGGNQIRSMDLLHSRVEVVKNGLGKRESV